MANSLQFELVSPEKLLLNKQVIMITVPGSEGDYGVLAGHAPLITAVRPGVIEVYEASDNTVSDRIFVAGGFAEVNEERCTVLAEEATPVAQLNRAEAENQLSKLTEEAVTAKDEDRAAVEQRLVVAQARVQAIAA